MKAFGINLILKKFDPSEEGKIVIPISGKKNADELIISEVVSVGSGEYLGDKIPMNVSEGDLVAHKESAGSKIIKDREKFTVVKITDIYCTIHK